MFQHNLGILAGSLQSNVSIKEDLQCSDELFKGIVV
jgi:hypothetical protein